MLYTLKAVYTVYSNPFGVKGKDTNCSDAISG
jgi:hypothetical protein